MAAILTPTIIFFAAALIAIPAEFSAKRNVQAYFDAVDRGCVSGKEYLIGSQTVAGRVVASTAERLFIIDEDRFIRPIKLESVVMVKECKARDTDGPAAMR